MATSIRAQVLIDGDPKGLRTALAESEADLLKLDQAGKKVDILATAIQNAKDARAEFTRTRDAAQLLDEQLALAKGAGAGKEAIKLLQAELKDANRELATAEKAWDKSREKLDLARSAAAAAGVDTRNLANEQARLKTETEAAAEAVKRNAQAIDDARRVATEKLAADRAAAAEEQRLAQIVEANIQRQKMAAQELLEAERRAAQEAQTAANKIAAGQREAAQAAEALNAAFRQLGVRPLVEIVAETNRLQDALARVRATGISGPEQQQAIAAFQTKLAALRAEANGLPAATAAAANGVQNLGTASEQAGSLIGGAARQMAALATAAVGLQSITGAAKDVIATGAAFETLEGRLKSLLGSSDKAKDVFAQIKDLAKTTPFEVQGLTEAYVKLTAFGLQPSMQQMRAITDTAATLGGGTEALQRVTLALGQAWTKSKLQGDEILQLAEAGVPVWDLLAKATGKNTAELQKMSEAGTLGRDVILKLIDALGTENMGASAALMETFNGAVSNAKDALSEFYALIAQSGVLEYLTGQLQAVLAEFDRMKANGELKAEAKAIADTFVKLAEGVKAAVQAVSAMSGVIKVGVEAYIAWRVGALAAIPALAGVSSAASAAALSARSMGAASAAAVVEARSLGAVSGAAASGVTLLSNALRLVKGFALVGLVTEVASFGMEIISASEKIEKADRLMKQFAKPVPLNGPAKDFELVETKAALARVKTEELAKAFYLAQEAGKGAGEAIKAALEGAKFDAPEGIADTIRGLVQIQGSARATGEEIRTGLVDRLKNLPARELEEFGILADMAFKRGKLSAQDLEFALGSRLDAAMLKLGVSASTASDGMTGAFRETSQGIEILTRDLQGLSERGVDTDRVFIDLITKTLPQASGRKEFEFLKDQVEKFGTAAGLAQYDVDKLLTMIQQKADGARPGIQSLAEAFSQLGLKSRESLKQAETSAKEAFDYIKNNGGTINEQRQAWEKYAEAAKAAHNGIIPPMIAAQGELYKIATAGQAAGKGVESGMTTASQAIQRVRSDAERLADQIDKIKSGQFGDGFGGSSMSNKGTYEDMRKAGVTPEQMRNAGYSSREIEDYINRNDQQQPGYVNRTVATQTTENYRVGIQLGLTSDQAKVFAERLADETERANAEARARAGATLGLNFTPQEYADLHKGAQDKAYEYAKTHTNAQTVQQAQTNVQDFFSSGRTVTVNLNINGKTTPVRVANQSAADDLVRALRDAEAATK
ncbi:tape measure protein [uncultured Zoogloea sp.]|uniref:tape measure protein n=1 Tax=uncultured Zoogloea sp. TaxID=160237 RepID=UPI0026196C9F|nr:tape measure protein [uncultured Zoogloea sp.]